MNNLIGHPELTKALAAYCEKRSEQNWSVFMNALGKHMDESCGYVGITVEELAKQTEGKFPRLWVVGSPASVVVGVENEDENRLRGNENGEEFLPMSMGLGNVLDCVLEDPRKPGVVFAPWNNGGFYISWECLRQIFVEGAGES